MKQLVNSPTQCKDAACLRRALAVTRTRRWIETPPLAARRRGAVVMMASMPWPPSHVDKRRGDEPHMAFRNVKLGFSVIAPNAYTGQDEFECELVNNGVLPLFIQVRGRPSREFLDIRENLHPIPNSHLQQIYGRMDVDANRWQKNDGRRIGCWSYSPAFILLPVPLPGSLRSGLITTQSL